MRVLKILWIHILALLSSPSADYKVKWGNTLLGGRRVDDVKDYPFMVSMQLNETHVCGGSLINARTVLTACHCLAKLTPGYVAVPLDEPLENFQFVAGTTDLDRFANTSAQIRKPRSFWYHPHCAFYQTIVYDVGVARLAERFETNQNIKPFKIFDLSVEGFKKRYNDLLSWDRNKPAPYCSAVGWGGPITENRSLKHLRALRVYSVLPSECRDAYSRRRPDIFGNFDFDAYEQTCVRSDYEPHPPVIGDSGSPFVCYGHIMGINSYYLNDSGLPTVFLSFATVLQYLLDTYTIICLEPGSNCSRPNAILRSPDDELIQYDGDASCSHSCRIMLLIIGIVMALTI